MAEAQAKAVNLGLKEEEFPSAVWDDFDGKIESIVYEDGTYGTQIVAFFRPEEYEYEPRGLEPIEEGSEEGMPRGWYSMGGEVDTYEVSEDGMSVFGPTPQRNCNGIKFILAAREYSSVKLIESLEPLVGIGFHFKARVWKGKIDGEERESVRLFPAGRMVGKAMIGEKVEKVGGRPARRSRRNRPADAETDNKGEEESPAEVEANDYAEDERIQQDIDAALDLLMDVIEEAGEEGLRKRQVPSKLLAKQEEFGEEMVTTASNRDLLAVAIKSGRIVQEGQVLTLGE